MLIDIIDDDAFLTSRQRKMLEEIITLANEKLGNLQEVELDLSIVTDKTIQQLNNDYREKNQPTDVLSFALTEVADDYDFDIFTGLEDNVSKNMPIHLGDIIISIETAKQQAMEYEHSLERELAFLAVHGFLHLNGYDHQTEEEEKEMFALQEEVLSDYGLYR